MKKKTSKYGALILLVASLFIYRNGRSQVSSIVYPDTNWEQEKPLEQYWSLAKLHVARTFFDSLPPASMLVIDHGKIAVQWGDPSLRIKISSMRKSLLNCLFGLPANRPMLDLDKTLNDLGIDDDPPLTDQEKSATIKMLLQARSGVYHSYVGGTPTMRARMPGRGTHPPGSFWYYNNWDFNVLGAIFERQTKTKIATAFDREIAAPLQMQDFRQEDMYYLSASPDGPEYERSNYPAYHFRMSARDLARFGYLYLCNGTWKGRQLVPAAWIEESTKSYSETNHRGGYGYLWWVNDFGKDITCFSAEGALGKFIIVIPDRSLVLIYLNHAEFPDDIKKMSADEIKKLPTQTDEQMGTLLRLVLDAQRDRAVQ